MNSDITSELSESFEEERPSFENLLRRFENWSPPKLSKSPSLNLLVFPSSLNDNNQFNVDQVKCEMSRNEVINSGKHDEICSNLESNFVAEKPPVPPRKENMELPMVLIKPKCTPATVRRSITMRNWSSMNYAYTTLPHNLKQNVEDHKLNHVLPIPAPRFIDGVYKPINRSNSCMTLTNQDTSAIKNKIIKEDAKLFLGDVIVEDNRKNFNAISKASCPISKNPLSLSRESTKGTRPNKTCKIKDFEPPPLPPRPASKRQSMSPSNYLSPTSQSLNDFKDQGLSNHDLVHKLIDLKSIFGATSALRPSSGNKNIMLLLIDIMIDIIQGYSNEESMEEESAWYSNIREFVQRETKTYIEVNQVSNNNCNVAYDKLLSDIVPKFIQNYGNVDYGNNNFENQTNKDETYEIICGKDEKPSNIDMLHVGEQERMFKILDEIQLSENRFINNMEENVYAYKNEVETLALGETLLAKVYPILEKILKMQYKFREVLNSTSHNLSWFLQTFLDFEELFELYIKFFGNKTTIFSDEFIPPKNEKIQSSENLSALFIKRLSNYSLFLQNIIEEIKEEGEVKEKANNVLKMIQVAMKRCDDAVAVSSISNSPLSKSFSGSLIDIRQGDQSMFLANLIDSNSYEQVEYGTFLLRNHFRLNHQKDYFTVFLFEKVIILTEETTKEKFAFKGCLKLNEILLLPPGKNKKALKLKDYRKSKRYHKDMITKLEAKLEAIQNIWRTAITKCLWSQLKLEKSRLKSTSQKL